MKVSEIRKGTMYTNGKATRYVYDIRRHLRTEVLYTNDAKGTSYDRCRIETFARWANREV